MRCLNIPLEGHEYAVAGMVIEDKEGYTDTEVVVVLHAAYGILLSVDEVSAHRKGDCSCT